MTLTADSFLSAAEALRWDQAVDSHENLYVELVTLNKRFAAMKKQQDAKFKRCDQLQAAISNFEMVTHEKGKMDDAAAAPPLDVLRWEPGCGLRLDPALHESKGRSVPNLQAHTSAC